MAVMGGPGNLAALIDAGACMDDTWIVVPLYNEASVIADVVHDLRRSFPHIVCVDDGSADGSGSLARQAGATVLRHPVNLGQGAALQTGVEFALRDPHTQFVVTFDADGQHQVRDAVEMVRFARASGADIVLGSRFLDQVNTIPVSRRLTLRAAVAFTRVTTGLRLSDVHNGLRVMARRTAECMDLRLHRMAHASEILSMVARQRLTYVESPVSIRYTKYSTGKGQGNLNALNIAFDLLVQRLRTAE